MSNKFDIVDLDSSRAAEILQKLKNEGEITLFVGSAISMWYPTLLPPGQMVTDYLGELLVEQFDISDTAKKKEIVEAIVATPFEYIWDQSPNNPLLDRIIADEYKNKSPNAIHEAIKNLVSSGLIKHVITTNYDTCLDQVFQNIGNMTKVVTEKDAQKINNNSNLYFKIHGSAEDGLESTIVYRLSHEGALPDWKRRVLRQCITNSTLLVIGYSGLDFEICPEIILAKPSQVIWNSYLNPSTDNKALTPNSLRVLQSQSQNTVIWGDMKKIFSLLGQTIPTMSISKTPPNWKLDTILSKIEIQIWACSIISPLGYGAQAENLAHKILNAINEKSPYYATTVFLLSDALFHKGKYIQSAENCYKAAQIHLNNNDLPNYVTSISRQSDALRCSGNFWDALLAISTARTKISNSKLSKQEKRNSINLLDLKELLVYRDFYEIAKWLKNPQLAKYYQSYSRKLISRIAKVAAKEGQWNIFQQAKMWAGRLEIDFDKVYKGTMQPLDDWFGFRHLGAIIPQMMATRDALWRNTTGKTTTHEEIKELIKQAENIECFPEIWKLSLAYNEKFAIAKGEPEFEWKKAFYECEYTDFLRTFKLANPRHR